MTENWRKDSEYMSYVADLLATPEVQKLSQYKQHVNGARRNLMKVPMPICTQELQLKMQKKLPNYLP